MKLLGHVQSLLKLRTMQEPKHGLGDVKPVVRLKQIRHISEHRRVHRPEVSVGGVQHQLVVWLASSSVCYVLH
jgi:hypothetical protein